MKKIQKNTMRVLAFFLVCAFIAALPLAAAKKKTSSQEKQAKQETVQQEASSDTASAAQADPAAVETSEEGKKPLYEYEAPKESDTSYGWLMFKALFVVALMGGGFYLFFKFVMKKAGVPVVGQGAVKILSVTPIGQNRSLHIIDVAGRIMLLGVTDSNVSLLSEITSKDEIDRIRLTSGKDPVFKETSFQDFLFKQIHNITDAVKNRKSGTSSKNEASFNDEMKNYKSEYKNENQASKIEYIMKQKERLRRLSEDDEE
ncbi:MAG: flagellar biosynthetic protein FliO [Spirochaetes bacterium]|nr:flagellar biosynthetic protein FliO [Spirochaetota bacterium]